MGALVIPLWSWNMEVNRPSNPIAGNDSCIPGELIPETWAYKQQSLRRLLTD